MNRYLENLDNAIEQEFTSLCIKEMRYAKERAEKMWMKKQFDKELREEVKRVVEFITEEGRPTSGNQES